MCEADPEKRIFKVAVASSDGQSIDLHLGQSREFLVYELELGGAARLVERRRTEKGCRLDPHSEKSTAALLEGVDVVLASQAGPGAIRDLLARGVQVFAVTGPISRALERFAARGRLVCRGSAAPAASATGTASGDCPGGCCG